MASLVQLQTLPKMEDDSALSCNGTDIKIEMDTSVATAEGEGEKNLITLDSNMHADTEVVKGVVTAKIMEHNSEIVHMSSSSLISNKPSDKEDLLQLPLFELQEKVLAFHGPLLYDAVVLRRKTDKNKKQSTVSYKYHLHFNGWAKKYDEWIDEASILKFSQNSINIQQDLLRVMYATKIMKDTSTHKTKTTKTLSKTSKKKKEKQMLNSEVSAPAPPPAEINTPNQIEGNIIDLTQIEEMKPFLRCVEPAIIHQLLPIVEIPLPNKLKQILFDDWVLIVQKNKLLDLPAQITVDKILEEYFEACGGIKESPTDLFISEIESAFAACICTLFYKPEIPQYEFVVKCQIQIYDALEEGDPVSTLSEIYGFPHLLRLITTFNHAAARSDFDEDRIGILLEMMGNFLAFLEEEADKYFTPSLYTLSPNDYKGLITKSNGVHKVVDDNPHVEEPEQVISMQ